MLEDLKISQFHNAITYRVNGGYIYFTSYSLVGSEVLMRNGLNLSARITMSHRQLKNFKVKCNVLLTELRIQTQGE